MSIESAEDLRSDIQANRSIRRLFVSPSSHERRLGGMMAILFFGGAVAAAIFDPIPDYAGAFCLVGSAGLSIWLGRTRRLSC